MLIVFVKVNIVFVMCTFSVFWLGGFFGVGMVLFGRMRSRKFLVWFGFCCCGLWSTSLLSLLGSYFCVWWLSKVCLENLFFQNLNGTVQTTKFFKVNETVYLVPHFTCWPSIHLVIFLFLFWIWKFWNLKPYNSVVGYDDLDLRNLNDLFVL